MIQASLVKYILRTSFDHPDSFRWSIQGFGMLRLYIDERFDPSGHGTSVRLHVWHPEHRVADVSDVHTHPWDFESEIVCGSISNKRMRESWKGEKFMRAGLKCGEDAALVERPVGVRLELIDSFTHFTGQTYSQHSNEIHRTSASPGTVTIVTGKIGPDRDHAYVYWPEGSEWVDAVPRAATEDEVQDFCRAALALL